MSAGEGWRWLDSVVQLIYLFFETQRNGCALLHHVIAMVSATPARCSEQLL